MLPFLKITNMPSEKKCHQGGQIGFGPLVPVIVSSNVLNSRLMDKIFFQPSRPLYINTAPFV